MLNQTTMERRTLCQRSRIRSASVLGTAGGNCYSCFAMDRFRLDTHVLEAKDKITEVLKPVNGARQTWRGVDDGT